ncbi:MAG: type II toxin-antitoxin system RelE/ParE family toxin [Candidatus Diapherotrites archaeon]
MIAIYRATYDEDWQKYFNCLDNATKERAAKKIKKILGFPKKGHPGLRARFFVDEIGRHRIIYRVFGEHEEVKFYFVGNHKEYEKWYKAYF